MLQKYLAAVSTLMMADYANAWREEDFEAYDGTGSILYNKEDENIFWNSLKYKEREENSDQIIVLYLTNSDRKESEQDWSQVDWMWTQVMKELEGGYAYLYAYDCAWPGTRDKGPINGYYDFTAVCGLDQFSPFMQILKPADIKYNPYTGKLMPKESVRYTSNNLSAPLLKSWVTSNLPNFVQSLSTQADAKEFADESGIHKVYLFSAKQKIPPIYQALNAVFRDRLRFAFVNEEAEVQESLAQKHGVIKFPTLLVSIEGSDEKHVFKGKMKLPELVKFAEEFALPVDAKKAEKVIQSKSDQTIIEADKRGDKKSVKFYQSFDDLFDYIGDRENQALVYVSPPIDAQNDKLLVGSIVENLAAELGDYIDICVVFSNDAARIKKEFKSKAPLWRLYPNGASSEKAKKEGSFEILVPSGLVLTEETDRFVLQSHLRQELFENYNDDVKSVTQKVLISSFQQFANEKFMIAYMHDAESEGGVPFDFRALSNDPYLKDDFAFFDVIDPDDFIIGQQELPTVSGIMKASEDEPNIRFFNFNGLKEVHYKEVQQTMINMVPELSERYRADLVQDSSTHLASKEKRSFGEIKNTKDFKSMCQSRKACAIALLPSITVIDYEAENHARRLEVLEKIEEQAAAALTPVHYSWINTTCHPEVFSYFDVDPNFVPTVVFINTAKNTHGSMIGQFDETTIVDYQDRFIHGRLPLFDVKVPQKQIKFEDIDCSKAEATVDAAVEDDDFDEIMAEILAEEEERRKELEEVEDRYTKKSKNDKKKGKGKKKKKSKKGAAKQEEL